MNTTTETPVFDCSPRIAAKLARCAEAARRQLHLTQCRCVHWITDEDRAILVRVTDGRGMPKPSRYRYLARLNIAAAAVAILAALGGPALATGCMRDDRGYDGQIMPGNLSAAAERRAIHLDATIGLRPFPVAFREKLSDPVRSVYALIPTDDAKGRPLNDAKAAAEFWRQRRDCGVFDTKEHAEQHLRFLSEPEGPTQ